jgi:hypothetical protein
MFALSPSIDTAGITEMGEIEIAPSALVACFGVPSPGDDFKISGEFVFVGADNEVFVLHDWKATNLWDQSFPAPNEFWSADQPVELSISSRDQDTSEFETWIREQIDRMLS